MPAVDVGAASCGSGVSALVSDAEAPSELSLGTELHETAANASSRSVSSGSRRHDFARTIDPDRTICNGRELGTPDRQVTSSAVPSLSSLIDFVKTDLAKLMRFAAVSAVTVPLGLLLLWVFLEVVEMRPVVANIVSVTLSTIPNYILNRYWVWNKRDINSFSREVAPFWAMALLGAFLSSVLVAIADVFTDLSFVFLAANFCAFGVVWVLKFFVLEKYLFGTGHTKVDS